jgi:fumarate reductase flavoprotein subunit
MILRGAGRLDMGDSKKSLYTEKLQTDIVVIGGGGSGLAAAVAAAEKGAKVIVLEKQKNPGGNSINATGLFATESDVQERMRLSVKSDEMFRVLIDYSHLEIDARIVRAFLNKSGDTIRWLEKKGIEFDGTLLVFISGLPPVYHCAKGGRGGAKIVKMLVKNCDNLGVRLLFQAPVKRILKDGKGNVAGVLATAQGKEFRITAKSVIIATGGHGSNKELLKKYHPSYTEDLYYRGVPLMGDGLYLAAEIGANTNGFGTLLYHGPQFLGPFEVGAVTREYFTVWVNKRGERFVDESCLLAPIDTANALDRQPDKVSYCLFDEKIKQSIIEGGYKRGAGPMKPGTRPSGLNQLLKRHEEEGQVKISDSWEGIARWIGAIPRVLKSAIDEYNRFCDQGYDKEFLKDRRYLLSLRTPPYYAIKCIQHYLDTIGGIKINHHMEVLDHNDDPISGLYAAGVTTSGWQPKTYCIILSGNAFGFAINSGRIAGENAAEYATAKKAN